MALSADQIRVVQDFVNSAMVTNPNNWVDVVTRRMDEVGVSPAMLQEAYPQLSVAQIQQAYNEARPAGMFAPTVGPVLPAGAAATPAQPSNIAINPAAVSRNIEQSAPATATPMLTGANPATAATVQLPSPSAPEPQPTSTGPTKTINNATVDKLAGQLRAQYDAINQNAGYEYGGKKSDLDNMFRAQAAKLAVNGINDLSDVGERDGMLINKATGDVMKKVNLKGNDWKNDGSTAFEFKEDIQLEDRGSFQRWGKDVSVDGQADYGINFVDGQAVMVPIWKDTKTDTGPLAAIAAVGLSLAFPGAGAAVGAYLAPTASAAVQAAIGSAALSGVTTGAITGDLDKALIAAALAGGGSYLSASGSLGEAFDSLGLTEYKDTFGISGGLETTAQAATQDAIQLAGQGLSEGQIGQILEQQYGLSASQALNIGKNAFDVAFAAQDALNLAAATSDPNAIAQNLIATGVDPIVANSMANAAVTGGNLSSIVADASSFVPTQGLFSATPTDMADFAGITTGGSGISLTPEQLSAIQRGEIPGNTFAEMVDNAKFIIPGTAAAGGMLDGVTDKAKEVISDLAGGSATDLVTGLLSSGIDYATAEKIAKEASALGRSAEATAIAAGRAANVPFTPYTVTTGAGSTAFGTGAGGQPTATVTVSPEYEALRQQALGQAGATLGAINPAQAAESLFQRSEALAAPARQRETEQLLSSLGARGLLGVSRNLPTVGGTTAGVNPYLESLLSAQRTAQANTALQAQQFGTQEAQRQAALANALIGTGQTIDTRALETLTQGQSLGTTALGAEQVNARNLLQATLGGQALRQPYENLGLMTRAGALTGGADLLKQGVNSQFTQSLFKEIFG